MLAIISLAVFSALPLGVSGHSAFWHPSMFGFNVTDKTFPYDNRPVAPIKNMNFTEWWFHNHLDYPPNAGDIFELPAGKPATAEIACNKGATTYFASSEGGDIRDPNNENNVCPNSPTQAYHTNGIDDLEGCALAIAYKSDAKEVKPEDFTVFSVNQTCVWTRFTEFKVPERMPPCPEGGCVCAFFWIHAPDSGGEENYMNGFKCNVTGSTSNSPVAESKLPRRCGADPKNNKLQDSISNCTYGAKTPFYWFNNEGNNMFEGTYSPPVYNDLYNFIDGAQDDIFVDSYLSIPDPSPVAMLPILADMGAKSSNVTVGSSNSGCNHNSSTSSVLASSTSTSVNASPTASATGNAAAAGTTTPDASNDGYAYKRDMSDAHILAERRLKGLTVNVESRQPARRYQRRSETPIVNANDSAASANVLEERRFKPFVVNVESRRLRGFRVNLESRRRRSESESEAAGADDGWSNKPDMSDAHLLSERSRMNGFRVNQESRRSSAKFLPRRRQV